MPTDPLFAPDGELLLAIIRRHAKDTPRLTRIRFARLIGTDERSFGRYLAGQSMGRVVRRLVEAIWTDPAVLRALERVEEVKGGLSDDRA